MDVKCPICDTVDQIDYDSPLAKRLRNRRKHLYLCPSCTERISEKTKKRHATGLFKLYQEQKEDDPYIK
ncbi:YlaI family protein [Amphibacillus sediminis]|uniref:YlaI family protein n=1 Tax=Amphibacillus sediminis TaxID=360185 RepID=UPI000831D7D8|nr:YlaI family protein [Amphibacillus sediminis]